MSIGICTPIKNNSTAEYILNELASIFRKHTCKEVVVDGNDILVDGYKVVGSSTYPDTMMFMLVAIISFSEKNDLINTICLKKSSKATGHIDFMSAEALKEEVCA